MKKEGRKEGKKERKKERNYYCSIFWIILYFLSSFCGLGWSLLGISPNLQ
jgi:hypothetical protein